MAVTDSTTHKTCKQCGEAKPLDAFYNDKHRKDGLSFYCKECKKAESKEWRYRDPEHAKALRAVSDAANRDNRIAWLRARYAANPDKFRKQKTEWTAANPEKAKAIRARYYENNKEKILKRQSAYVAANAERIIERNRKWALRNKDSVQERQRSWYYKNRARILAASVEYRAANADKIKALNAKYASENREARRIHEQNRRARKRERGGKLSTGLSDRLFALQKGKCACCGKRLGDDYHLDHIVPLALGGTNTDDNIQLLRAECNLRKSAKHPVDFMQERGFLL